jgi:hypothetical protein
MARSARETALLFSQPVRQITIMLIVVGLFAAGGYLAYSRVASVFLANPYLNGVIGVVFLFGVASCFFQVFQLSASVSWIEGFAQERPGHRMTIAPQLLAPLAALLRSRGANRAISASSTRSILDSVSSRIEEARDITRYIVNLLIFLGLLGTFYGLATTVPAVVETIRSLSPSANDTGLSVFDKLMTGLEAQLGGMGTAFSSSLLGLAGSLVVGLLELFAGHGQNRFYRELEEWLSTITRIGYAGADGEAEGAGGIDSSVVVEVLDQFATQMDTLQKVVKDAETGRIEINDRLTALTEAVHRLATNTAAEAGTAATLRDIAQGQTRIAEALDQLNAREREPQDAEARMRLRSIDVQLLRLLEEVSAGRQESIADLRHDLSTLTGAIRQLSRGGGQPPASQQAAAPQPRRD